MPFSTDLFIRSDKGFDNMYLASFKMYKGQEYSPYDFLVGINLISSSISLGDTGLKEKELEIFTFGRYSTKEACEFDICDANLCPTDEKYLLKMSGNSEILWVILLL